MGSDVGQIFPTASLHRDHLILYALVCEKELSHMGKNSGNLDLVYEKLIYDFAVFLTLIIRFVLPVLSGGPKKSLHFGVKAQSSYVILVT